MRIILFDEIVLIWNIENGFLFQWFQFFMCNLQLYFEIFYHLLHHFRWHLNIHFVMIFYRFSSWSKFKCTDCFIHRWGMWWTCHNQWCLVIPTQWFLQNTCQFWVSIWDMFIVCCECMNHITQTRQWEVDLLGLFQYFTLSTSFANLFWSCQIYQIQLALLLCLIGQFLLDFEHENGMWSWTVLIYSSGCHLSSLLTQLNNSQQLILTL